MIYWLFSLEQAGSTSLAEWEGKMAADFAAELKKNREEKMNASKKKEKKEKKKGKIWGPGSPFSNKKEA